MPADQPAPATHRACAGLGAGGRAPRALHGAGPAGPGHGQQPEPARRFACRGPVRQSGLPIAASAPASLRSRRQRPAADPAAAGVSGRAWALRRRAFSGCGAQPLELACAAPGAGGCAGTGPGSCRHLAGLRTLRRPRAAAWHGRQRPGVGPGRSGCATPAWRCAYVQAGGSAVPGPGGGLPAARRAGRRGAGLAVGPSLMPWRHGRHCRAAVHVGAHPAPALAG
mmetsp:Transcript_53763/g.126808  ORF Transcript_53763/g.126808 Transcript_53763/m.126808 type:complete len:225 (-) Transcript_53763:1098-1772(-)